MRGCNTRSMTSRFLLSGLGVLAFLWFAAIPAAPALAQTDADKSVTLVLRGDETPDALARTIKALEATGRKVTLRLAGAGEAQPPATVSASAPTPVAPAKAPTRVSTAETRIEAFWEDFVDGFDAGNAAIPRAVELPDDWQRSWMGNRNGLTGPSAGVRILASLALAIAGAGLFRYASAGWFARRLRPAGPEFTTRLIASGYGLLQDALTIAIALGLLRFEAGLWLPEPDLAAAALRTAGNGAAIGACYIAVGRFLLAPGAPERRLLPLPRAERHFRILCIYAIATPIVVVSAILAQRVAGSREAVAGLFAVSALAITAFKVWWFIDARHDLTALVLQHSPQPGPGLRLLAILTPWLYVAFSIFIWMVGRAAMMMPDGGHWAASAGLTQLIIVLAPIIAAGVTNLIACRRAKLASVEPLPPLKQALGLAGQAAAGGVVWAGGFYLMARLWASFVLEISSGDFSTFSRQAAGVAVLAFAGWVMLVFLRAFFDAYTPRRSAIGPADEDEAHEDNVPSRLATVLPVLRGVVLGAVIGLTTLVVLSRLGVDIGPLLAGFGILGLAISFGSQALVRDIVSGFFFMIEDAFRVGEYVDTGKLKGTVEKISLRSMQLRHQSGQIHTVPFGQIASLTNASRDWATVKFNVRLDHSADIELARKAIKKTGIALLEDPEYGPHFIAPLKMQGVADITDSAIVIRLKFTSKPNQASGVQREALKRVYRALNEAHIPFASNAVTVRGGEGNYAGGAAAAIQALPPPSPLAPAAG
ncbi:mechanosensitive ion channel family protein [Bosea lathyri]|uniref:Small-conductance mechanosensitive channel n=1 Tax=Bosea lathyri TaxID=1036778 RepID=A0A1H5VBB9_9HYPH|nr:mechanosensitive ion channel family protein [Bosea lathyri]SEF84406.1 Small-conductance mechanosensitive channel [Bosea lathyri]